MCSTQPILPEDSSPLDTQSDGRFASHAFKSKKSEEKNAQTDGTRVVPDTPALKYAKSLADTPLPRPMSAGVMRKSMTGGGLSVCFATAGDIDIAAVQSLQGRFWSSILKRS